jgi:multidrug efflux system membrane fusion protein
LRWVFGLILLAVLVWAGWTYGWPQVQALLGNKTPNATSRAVQGVPQPVAAATIGTGDIRILLHALGTISPLATVTVKTQIAGQLVQIGFQEGQLVQKGDFLAQIDPRPYQVALELAEAALARDQSILAGARIDLARYRTLVAQDSLARQTLDTQTVLVATDEAVVKADQANVDNAKLNLTFCHIIAPVTGRVGLRQVDQGNYVQMSDANGLVVITQLQPISAVFSVPEDNIPAILKQMHAGVTLPVSATDRADVAQIATGVLSTLDNQVDTTTGTVKLRAIFANADESLFPSQFVNAHLLVDTLKGVVVAPTASIQRGQQGTYVYVIGDDGAAHVRPITLGPPDGAMVAVAKGLNAGERVVIDGADRLRDGAKVSVAGAARAPGEPGQRRREGAGGNGQAAPK